MINLSDAISSVLSSKFTLLENAGLDTTRRSQRQELAEDQDHRELNRTALHLSEAVTERIKSLKRNPDKLSETLNQYKPALTERIQQIDINSAHEQVLAVIDRLFRLPIKLQDYIQTPELDENISVVTQAILIPTMVNQVLNLLATTDHDEETDCLLDTRERDHDTQKFRELATILSRNHDFTAAVLFNKLSAGPIQEQNLSKQFSRLNLLATNTRETPYREDYAKILEKIFSTQFEALGLVNEIPPEPGSSAEIDTRYGLMIESAKALACFDKIPHNQSLVDKLERCLHLGGIPEELDFVCTRALSKMNLSGDHALQAEAPLTNYLVEELLDPRNMNQVIYVSKILSQQNNLDDTSLERLLNELTAYSGGNEVKDLLAATLVNLGKNNNELAAKIVNGLWKNIDTARQSPLSVIDDDCLHQYFLYFYLIAVLSPNDSQISSFIKQAGQENPVNNEQLLLYALAAYDRLHKNDNNKNGNNTDQEIAEIKQRFLSDDIYDGLRKEVSTVNKFILNYLTIAADTDRLLKILQSGEMNDQKYTAEYLKLNVSENLIDQVTKLITSSKPVNYNLANDVFDFLSHIVLNTDRLLAKEVYSSQQEDWSPEPDADEFDGLESTDDHIDADTMDSDVDHYLSGSALLKLYTGNYDEALRNKAMDSMIDITLEHRNDPNIYQFMVDHVQEIEDLAYERMLTKTPQSIGVAKYKCIEDILWDARYPKTKARYLVS